MSEQIEVPVFIVGGGIVGLSASLFLSRQGIRSLLVERHAGTSIHPRARGFNARTMELYRELGLEEAIRNSCPDLNLSSGMYRGYSVADVVGPMKRKLDNPSRGEAPTAGLLERISSTRGTRATQDFAEPVLLDAARAQQQAELRFSTECVDFTQDESGVTATIQNRKSGARSTVRCRYMLGVDGAGSPVRQKLGIKTTGAGVLGNLVNVLFEADLHDFVRGREFSVCVVDQPEVLGGFASINNSNRWVFHICYDPKKGQSAEDFTPERCEELVRIGLGIPDVEIKIISALPWQAAVRVVETLRSGNVFLAGDAAHQMPPYGGQGANSGIADVHNLSWKLSAVLKNQAGPALLDTYNIERLPVGRLVADESGAVTDKDGLFKLGTFTLLGVAFRLNRLIGYGYKYASSSIIPDQTWQFFRIPWNVLAWLLDLNGRPGTRVPHLWVQKDGQKVSTLDVCGSRFVLLAGEDGAAWSEAAANVAESLKIDLAVHRIGRSGDLVDSNNQWPSLAGISTRGALLIRPDGFTAWRAYAQPEPLTNQLREVMEKVLCR